jgi:hypothetical protein
VAEDDDAHFAAEPRRVPRMRLSVHGYSPSFASR